MAEVYLVLMDLLHPFQSANLPRKEPRRGALSRGPWQRSRTERSGTIPSVATSRGSTDCPTWAFLSPSGYQVSKRTTWKGVSSVVVWVAYEREKTAHRFFIFWDLHAWYISSGRVSNQQIGLKVWNHLVWNTFRIETKPLSSLRPVTFNSFF